MKRIPASLLKTNYRYKIAGETEKDFILQVSEDLSFPFKKSIVMSNRMDSASGFITISESMYQHHVAPLIKKKDEQAAEQLTDNFGLVMANRNMVLINPAYYLIRTPWLCSGGSMSGPIHYCLGALLEAWKQGNSLEVKNNNGQKVLIISLGGSNLSGMITARGWNTVTQSPEVLHRNDIPGGLPVWLPKFAVLASKTREKLPAQYQYINELLEKCRRRMPVKPPAAGNTHGKV